MLESFSRGYRSSVTNSQRFVTANFDEIVLSIGAIGAFTGLVLVVLGLFAIGAIVGMSALLIVGLAIIWNG